MTYLFDGINHPTVAQVRASGAVGCLLYGGTPADSLGKDFTAAQYASYKADGLLTAFVFENTANDMATGMAGGAAHADALLADLRSKGVLPTEPIGATVDEHVTAANIPLAVQYQTGFYRRALALGWAGARGGYGFAEFLIAIHDAQVCDWFWGAGSRSSLPPYTNIWQDNTGTINVGGSADDRDWILVPLPTGGMMADFTSPAGPLTPDGKSWTTLFGTTLTYGSELDAVLEALLLGAQQGPTWPAGPGVLQRLADLATAVDGLPAAVAAVVQSEITAEQTALLAAIKTLPPPLVQQITADPAAVANQLIAAGLPGDLVGALLAVLKAAPSAPAA